MDEPAFVGCVLEARVIGVIEGQQREKGGPSERNDRLLAVAVSSHTHSNIHKTRDLNPMLLDELEHFLINYHVDDGKKFKVLGSKGPGDAAKLLRKSERRHR